MKSENKKILVITGSAPCVMDDIEMAKSLFTLLSSPSTLDYMAIGLDAVDKYPWPIKYFATQHPKDIEAAIGRRVLMGANTDFKIISHEQQTFIKNGRHLIDVIISLEKPYGSSSLMGVRAGIQLGYEKIIVCGCPLTGANGNKVDYSFYRDGWTAKYEEIKDKTRSMSGWTKELLGAPTKEWIND